MDINEHNFLESLKKSSISRKKRRLRHKNNQNESIIEIVECLENVKEVLKEYSKENWIDDDDSGLIKAYYNIHKAIDEIENNFLKSYEKNNAWHLKYKYI